MAKSHQVDFLVMGAGVAGLRAAIELRVTAKFWS